MPDTLEPLENAIGLILKDETHDLHIRAKKFVEALQGMWATPQGREFLEFFCALAHPYVHAPCSDPVISAHRHGRSEVTALLVRFGSPEAIPLFVPKSIKPQTPEPNGLHQRTTGGKGSRRSSRTGSKPGTDTGTGPG